VPTAEVTWNFGSTYRRWSVPATFLSVLTTNLQVTRRAKEKTDRRGSTVRGSAAAAYQDAVVSVSEIIMWCDVSQVSFARGSARIVLSCSRVCRSRPSSFFPATLYPLLGALPRSPVCVPFLRRVRHACRVSALRAGRRERVT